MRLDQTDRQGEALGWQGRDVEHLGSGQAYYVIARVNACIQVHVHVHFAVGVQIHHASQLGVHLGMASAHLIWFIMGNRIK